MKSFLHILIILLFPVTIAFGQFKVVPVTDLPDLIDSLVRLRSSNNATFQGIVYSVSDDFVTIIAPTGEAVTILKDNIKLVQVMEPGLDKKAFYQDSASNRLIVMPTGFAMETGEFHIADQEIAAVTMSYGVNPHFSLWGGISIPGAIVSGRYIQPLGTKAALSIGSFAGLSWIEFTGLLIPYTVLSIGAPENNFTVGAGGLITFSDQDLGFDAAILAIGGKWVLSDTTAIVTENWIFWGRMYYGSDPDTGESLYRWDPVPSMLFPAVVFRIAGERFSWDIGAIIPCIVQADSGSYQLMGFTGETNVFIPLPILSFTYRID